MAHHQYSASREADRVLKLLTSIAPVPEEVARRVKDVSFTSTRDFPYFPIPFKETEVGAALKAIEGCVASSLVDLKGGTHTPHAITVDLERTTAFLCQTYLATVDGYGKLDKEVKKYLKDTDLLQAQSNPYRRMSANLYETKRAREYYHIHGSLEASTTLQMIGLDPYRPDLSTHEAIVEAIESKVRQYSTEELEDLNAKHRQAGVPALEYDDFIKTPHGKTNVTLPPWSLDQLEGQTPPTSLPERTNGRILGGVKVLELCRIIAGPVMGRILAEYGADVLKVTSPNLSDVPFFQVDGNMGKHTTDLDLKTPEGKEKFDALLLEADVVLDGYRPGALEKLGYGLSALTALAQRRQKGIVYVNENCFGFNGDWAHRPGWQQIADCVTGIAWEQGKFMKLNEPVVPPFPISDYGTGCMGAIAALTGLYHRARTGGSWHGKTSLMQYDLLLFKAGRYDEPIQQSLRELAGEDFLKLKHSNSVDQISGTALRRLRELFPELFDSKEILDTWYSNAYGAETMTVRPVTQIEGIDNSFQRASRPNGSDPPTWEFAEKKDACGNATDKCRN